MITALCGTSLSITLGVIIQVIYLFIHSIYFTVCLYSIYLMYVERSNTKFENKNKY